MFCLNTLRRARLFPILLAVAGFLSIACNERARSTDYTPDDDRMRVGLGKDLFSDKRLSSDETISCASCHDVGMGGDDGSRTATGIGGVVGPINTPTVLNSSLNFAQFWDGRAATLEQQVHGPVTNPIEMGNSWDPVLARLSTDDEMARRFDAIYEDGITAVNVADAIAAYERSLVTVNSPFDRYLQGDAQAISPEAAEGHLVFREIGCISCHQGRAFGGNMYERFGVTDDYFELRGTPITKADLGRYNVTGREEDKYKFKVPSLLNVALTAPYFHDGSAETLELAVRMMVRAQVGRPTTDGQVAQLVAFLQTLSGAVPQEIQ